MRAWQVHAQGEPEKVLRLGEVPVPEPGPGQLLVRVRAVALNFPDVLLCRGEYQIRPELPFTPGVELCGEVTAVGDGVDPGRVGSRVIGNPVLPQGALADYTLMHTAEAFDAPAALDDAEAAALHIAYQTAWFALHRRAGLKAGETVLVHAAAGGVGSATVQLAKAAGARVIGVVGERRKPRSPATSAPTWSLTAPPRTSSARSSRPPAAGERTWSSTRSAARPTRARPSASRSRAGS